MTTELILPLCGEFYPTVDGILVELPKEKKVQKTLLLVTPRTRQEEGYFDFEHFVWTTEGQAYRAYAEVSVDTLWELTFGKNPVYASDPHSYLLGRLLVGGELVFLGGPVKTYEAGMGATGLGLWN